MRVVVAIDRSTYERVRRHLLRSEVEEAAFLFADERWSPQALVLQVRHAYLVPPEGWEAQHADYLELKDNERGHVLKLARRGGFALVDCHVHHGQGEHVAFSPSDRRGITEFVAYVRWKLGGASYVAMVWSDSAVDAVAWPAAAGAPLGVAEVRVGTRIVTRPRTSWFDGRGRWP